MRYWLGFHLLIILGYFALALVFWGPTAMVWLSITTGFLCIYFRMEFVALSKEMMYKKDLWVVAIVLLCLGFLIVVLPYALKELFWYLKGVFFGSDRITLFWEFGRIAFVSTGIGVVYGLLFFCWVIVRSRYVGAETLHTAFFGVVLGSKGFKTIGLFVLPLILAGGLAVVVAISFVVLGNFSWAEIFGEASIDLAVELEYAILAGGFLLSFIPVCFLTRLLWTGDDLTSVLENEASD